MRKIEVAVMTLMRSSIYTILALVLAACSQSPISVVLDPQIAESQKLTPNDARNFGYSIAIDSDFMVVGTSNYESAYLYQKALNGSWQFVKKLVASDSVAGNFGSSVAISGNTIIVGAYADDIGANINQGSAYIFERDQGGTNNWGEVKKLIASDGADGDSFGSSVAISGNTVVVGVLSDDIGTNTDQGSAYIYQRNQGGTNTWGEVKKLFASDGTGSDWFGSSVAISGYTVVVGAPINNGSQGSVYLFERDQGGANTWGEVKKLIASDGAVSNYFGYSVDIDSNTVVVGVPGRSKFRGIAYLYKRDAGGLNMWGQVSKLLASDRLRNDQNGHSVAINGNTIAVGTPWDDNGQGSVYIY
jgi:glutamine cyclotransferase